MRRLGFVIALFCLVLAGCAPALKVTPAATASPVPEFLPSPSATLLPTETLTPTLTATPVPPTVTPLPTIPTFTPTFDGRTVVTSTPASKGECPPKNPNLMPNFDLSMEGILDFLNKGGDVSFVINKARTYHQTKVRKIRYQDVNGDTIPEIIFIDATVHNFTGQLIVLACHDSRFISIGPPIPSQSWPINLFAITDINKNGIPEIFVTYRGCSGSGCYGFYTYEWNGNGFKNTTPLYESQQIWGLESIKFQDIDNNGVDEILMAGDYPGSCCASDYILWRLKTVVFLWNGANFTQNHFYFSPPKYRFQAIQDGDREIYFGHYSKAESAYQAAIFNNRLDWWSEEKWDYLLSAYVGGGYHEPIGPTPVPDNTEYPRLAAYAYYRMIILHTFLGEMEAAQVKYATLQEKFPAGNPGHPYVEMATDFWNAYQSSGKMYNACAAAIAYADAHPEILTPLGSDYHGTQSHTYIPADVCPLR